MSNNFFENPAFREIILKNIVEPDRPQMTLHCMLDTYDYKHTLRICNTFSFPW
jgi:hypothetical protein